MEKRKSQRKRHIEIFKSIVLIMLLFLCAAVGISLNRYLSASQSEPRAFPAWSDDSYEEGRIFTVRLSDYMRPDFIIVGSRDNRSFYLRGGEGFDELDGQLSEILKSIFKISSAPANYECAEDEWTAALASYSVYIKLPCVSELDEIAKLSSVSLPPYFGDVLFDELAVESDRSRGGISLYLRSSVSGRIHKYITNLNTNALDEFLKKYGGSEGKKCIYGFELASAPEVYGIGGIAEQLAGLDSSAVLPFAEVSVPQVRLGVPARLSGSLTDMTGSAEIGRIIDIFGLDSERLSVRCGRDGVKYFEDANSSLRIYPSGKIAFNSTAGVTNGAFSMSESIRENAFAGVGDMILRVCKALEISPSGGGASLSLSSFEESGGTAEITFDYHIGGVPLKVSENGHAVSATVRNGHLTRFEIYLKNFSISANSAVSESAPSAVLRLAEEAPFSTIKNIFLLYDGSADGACGVNWLGIRE